MRAATVGGGTRSGCLQTAPIPTPSTKAGWPSLCGAAVEGQEQCLTLLLGAAARTETSMTPIEDCCRF